MARERRRLFCHGQPFGDVSGRNKVSDTKDTKIEQ